MRRCELRHLPQRRRPGTLIMLFAEYLRKNDIEPADLGLHHPGLQSRWLLFELDALFEDKSGKKDQPEK